MPNRLAWYLKDCSIAKNDFDAIYSAWRTCGFSGARAITAKIITRRECPSIRKWITGGAPMDTSPVPYGDIELTGYVFKRFGGRHLELHAFRPVMTVHPSPVFMFFHGGGWISGGVESGYPLCEFLARKGIITVAAEYRTREMFGGTPFDCVRDAKSAVRWLRAHAGELGIDSSRIALSGVSAGGHLAAASAILNGLNDPGDDVHIRCTPDASILLSPVLNSSPGRGYGYHLVKNRYREISLLHNVNSPVGPLLLIAGDADPMVRMHDVKQFISKVYSSGYPVRLVTLKGGHDAPVRRENRDFVYGKIVIFLQDIGYLPIQK